MLYTSKSALCILLLYTESHPRSEHIDRKTTTFGTFFGNLFFKYTLQFQADCKALFFV